MQSVLSLAVLIINVSLLQMAVGEKPSASLQVRVARGAIEHANNDESLKKAKPGLALRERSYLKTRSGWAILCNQEADTALKVLKRSLIELESFLVATNNNEISAEIRLSLLSGEAILVLPRKTRCEIQTQFGVSSPVSSGSALFLVSSDGRTVVGRRSSPVIVVLFVPTLGPPKVIEVPPGQEHDARSGAIRPVNRRRLDQLEREFQKLKKELSGRVGAQGSRQK